MSLVKRLVDKRPRRRPRIAAVGGMAQQMGPETNMANRKEYRTLRMSHEGGYTFAQISRIWPRSTARSEREPLTSGCVCRRYLPAILPDAGTHIGTIRIPYMTPRAMCLCAWINGTDCLCSLRLRACKIMPYNDCRSTANTPNRKDQPVVSRSTRTPTS